MEWIVDSPRQGGTTGNERSYSVSGSRIGDSWIIRASRILRMQLSLGNERHPDPGFQVLCNGNSFGPCNHLEDRSTVMNIKKLLLPVDFPNPSLHVIHQAASLARHFHSEIVMMHVITPLSRTAGVPDKGSEADAWDMLAEIKREAEKSLDRSLITALTDIPIRCMLVKGKAAYEIVRTAKEEKTDLIMMPSYGHAFSQFLLGSVTAKVLYGTDCPVWTDAHVENPGMQELKIPSVLCAVDLPNCDRKAVSWAVQIAEEFRARLTLAYVTPGVEMWGPGGNYVNAEHKKMLIDSARRDMAQLQQDMGIKADVFIGSGDLPMMLSEAVKQSKADLLVTGCHPYAGHLRTHGYAIICSVPIPVLSV